MESVNDWRISKHIYEDFCKYGDQKSLEDFVESNNAKLKIITTGWIDSSSRQVLDFVFNYYNEHLPVNADVWIKVHQSITRDIMHKDIIQRLYSFVKDNITQMLYDYDEVNAANYPIKVVGFISEKTSLIPVFKIEVPMLGLKAILCFANGNWKLSIESEKPIMNTFKGLFDYNRALPSEHTPGFNKEIEFTKLVDNKNGFTCLINSEYNLYTALYIIKRQCQMK